MKYSFFYILKTPIPLEMSLLVDMIKKFFIKYLIEPKVTCVRGTQDRGLREKKERGKKVWGQGLGNTDFTPVLLLTNNKT